MYKLSLQIWHFSFQTNSDCPEINHESLNGPPSSEKWGMTECSVIHSSSNMKYMEISDHSQYLRNTRQGMIKTRRKTSPASSL